MRSGACTVQQALTAEAASAVKLSLNLARRRGHAQVTPLHVAATLLTSPSSSSNLLRRACLKSHPHHLNSHPLQCRALELCFNVALNRLPTTPPPSSGSLIHAQPSLSNALVAALKRAQAHQRRGCIEQQQQQFHHQQQQQQPLLAIRVELEQLVISILDDPSVSRVMREAGFSSTTVKSNIEEDSSSNACSFFFDPGRDIAAAAAAAAGFLHTHNFLKPYPDQNPLPHFSAKEDLKVVLDVMVRKQGRRNNAVVVGDSVWVAEGVVSEFVRRLERGEVPDEIRTSHFIRMQLSYVQLRVMSRGEVELKVSELRRKLSSSPSNVIVYVGDLSWAADDYEVGRDGFRPAEHLIEEIRRLVSESRACKMWLMATASYQSWMRCQVRHPSLEAQWALQAVVVPSGGLKLSLQAAPPSGPDSRVTKLTQYPLQMLEPKDLYPKEEEDKLLCCGECTYNFEREAKDINNGSTQLPFWLQPLRPENPHKDSLPELRRKWNRLCLNLHHSRQSSVHLLPPFPSSHPWWSSILADSKNKSFMELNSVPFSNSTPKFGNVTPILTSQIKNKESPKPWLSDVKTTLALGNPAFTDTASSMEQRNGVRVNQRELSRKLQENIPWHSETVPAIVEALLDGQSKNGIWLLVQGTDRVAKRRLARVAAESFCGSADKLVCISARRSADGVEELAEAMRKDPKCVILVEDIDQASGEFIRTISQCINTGYLKGPFGREVDLSHGVFILTASSSRNLDSDDESHDRVLRMRLCVEEISSSDHKRKNSEADSPLNEKKKKMKSSEAAFELDLNICAEGSDLTHEIDGNNGVQLPNGLLEAIGAAITMDEIPGGGASRIGESIVARLSLSLEGQLVVDRTAAEGLTGAMGWFLESEFERWLKEIFELSVATVRNGGKVRLGMEGRDGNVVECGFLGSVLPKRIHVDGGCK